jgi:hypothetical protein
MLSNGIRRKQRQSPAKNHQCANWFGLAAYPVIDFAEFRGLTGCVETK